MADLRIPPEEQTARAGAPGAWTLTGRPCAGRRPWTAGLHAAVLRIDAMTPVGRDRAVDVLRSLATLGVVLGHWLVSAVVLQAGGHLAADSPLSHMPGLAPLSWVLQPLAVFFFVGGRVGSHSYGSARASGMGYGTWLAQRLRRLLRPTLALALTWALALVGLATAGMAPETMHTLTRLSFSPLWFLAVYAALTALTPLVQKWGIRIAVTAGMVVAATDGAGFIFGDTGWVESLRDINIIAGWLVPYCLGTAWVSGAFTRRRSAIAMLVGGAAATAALMLWGGYPVSMVGVPGESMSNLNPPTLAAVTFGLTQCGGALLLRRPLRRLVGQPVADKSHSAYRTSPRATPRQFLWATVALLNLSTITVFLWHQTAMLVTTVVPLALGQRYFALHASPDSPLWVVVRLAWTPAFAAVLVLLWAAFRDWDRETHKGGRR
ncbi:acyltransferase family protein [Streptomyces sp. NPDC059080]|uniref:acyltransferase family protein n=1 Tax=Streptomyces sp. NPDC059080 TaxID=3346718 RepID=UPI0036B3A3E9